MQKPKFHIVATGPESSGKTTFVKELKGYFDLEVVDEYAREYLKDKPKYMEEDLLEIARGQLNLLKNINSEFILSDTDLLTIKIWSEVKYGNVNPQIIELLHQNLPDAYLLFRPDIPWEDDPLRESPNDRDELFEIYLKEIKALNVPFIIVEGDRKNRLDSAKTFISNLLSK